MQKPKKILKQNIDMELENAINKLRYDYYEYCDLQARWWKSQFITLDGEFGTYDDDIMNKITASVSTVNEDKKIVESLKQLNCKSL